MRHLAVERRLPYGALLLSALKMKGKIVLNNFASLIIHSLELPYIATIELYNNLVYQLLNNITFCRTFYHANLILFYEFDQRHRLVQPGQVEEYLLI